MKSNEDEPYNKIVELYDLQRNFAVENFYLKLFIVQKYTLSSWIL